MKTILSPLVAIPIILGLIWFIPTHTTWFERSQTSLEITSGQTEVAGDTASPSSAEDSEDGRLNAFFEDVFQRTIKDSPIFQAQLGIKTEDYGKWDDFSDAGAVRQNTYNEDDLKRLAEFDYAALSPTARVSYDIFKHQAEQQQDNFKWRYHSYAVSQMNSVASILPTILQNWHRIDTVSDAEAYISRLNNTEQVMNDLAEVLEDRTDRGIIPPKFVFPPVREDIQTLTSGAPFDDGAQDNAVYSDFKRKVAALTIDDEAKAALLAKTREALLGPYRSGYATYLDALDKMAATADSNDGVWRLPDGDSFYQQQIANATTLKTMNAHELHELGLAEVDRIHKEMRKIQRTIGIEGDLSAIFEYVRTDPSNFYPNTKEGRQAYLNLARQYVDNVYSKTDEYFNILPKAPIEVRAVEDWREATAAIAFYSQPAPDGSRPGIFYVNLADMSASQIHTLESLSYHEGVPGHHFQVAIAQELEGLPNFRKFSVIGAYTEGWALYAELLGKEMGFFEEPLSDFGRLQYELLRAVRLVVDTGAHSKRWSREQMIDYMVENTPMSREDIVREVERYLVIPGQALSYKVGMLKILELREKARRELGSQFDIREFHDAVLKDGAVPLPVLEDLVARYIDEKKGASQ